MSKLPVVSGAECVKALGKVGFIVYRSAEVTPWCESHRLRKLRPPITKNLIAGLRAIIRQAGLTVEEFIELI